CHVPCSGDGITQSTFNENDTTGIRDAWAISKSLNIHALQLAIAWRSVQLLVDGGEMVYTTNSLSPYENEAVVAEIIRRGRGALELVDVTPVTAGPPYDTGLTTWPV
ncbi:hypothetical protein B484DRAFT_320143, partial [Ochromonadaceae sp. CCMP2298]